MGVFLYPPLIFLSFSQNLEVRGLLPINEGYISLFPFQLIIKEASNDELTHATTREPANYHAIFPIITECEAPVAEGILFTRLL